MGSAVSAPTFTHTSFEQRTGSLAGTLNANNSESNQLDNTLPAGFDLAVVYRISIFTASAQTHHPADGLETCLARLMRSGQVASIDVPFEGFIVDKFEGASANADGWIQGIRYPFGESKVRTGDVIRIMAPPADNGGSPTGDYYIRIDLVDIDWN